jgi:hypothetical protein
MYYTNMETMQLVGVLKMKQLSKTKRAIALRDLRNNETLEQKIIRLNYRQLLLLAWNEFYLKANK